MGILNVTPDSFSDGGQFVSRERAVARALAMVAQGADMIDIGGESTRPGSDSVRVEEELERVVPVIESLRARSDVAISIDTSKPEVAMAALEAGAQVLNDVSMLRGGTALAALAARYDADYILMHSRTTPKEMQEHVQYGDVVEDVLREWRGAAESVMAAGVPAEKLWLDPGIGFAKTVEQNLELLARTDELTRIGHPVLVGPSRKSFIGGVTGAPVDDRLGGTAAAVTAAVLGGARGVRVHDVDVMVQVVRIASAIRVQSGRAG